jgi:hypothetical protein
MERPHKQRVNLEAVLLAPEGADWDGPHSTALTKESRASGDGQAIHRYQLTFPGQFVGGRGGCILAILRFAPKR